MLPETIDPLGSPGDLARKWRIDCRLARALHSMAADMQPVPLQILSGFRTAQEQLALAGEGRPAAAVDVSTHTSCPATGADLRLPTLASTDSTKAFLGRFAVYNGLRWGGGSPVSDTGIPMDWNHVDLGPRRT